MLLSILETLNSGVTVDGDILSSFHMISAANFLFPFFLSLEVSLVEKTQMKNKDTIHKDHILNCYHNTQYIPKKVIIRSSRSFSNYRKY